MSDLFYVPEIEMVEVGVSIAIVDVSPLEKAHSIDEELFKVLIECKDNITVEEFIEQKDIPYSRVSKNVAVMEYAVEIVNDIFPEYVYVPSFVLDDGMLVTPTRSFTFDRVIGYNPLKLVILLRTKYE